MQVVELAKAQAAAMKLEGELNADAIRRIGRAAAGHLSPMASAVGGIAAHEIAKACSAKFTPIVQWLYVDAREAVPEKPLDMAEYAPRNNR